MRGSARGRLEQDDHVLPGPWCADPRRLVDRLDVWIGHRRYSGELRDEARLLVADARTRVGGP
ncbi:hypothetical protein [Lentzea nigeriaca]|uniref:hypothetical protein n=1 Tax=Lentzea nigeriaca TaxID=1128665 RepID=UPI00195CA6C8|nr:hypothetical protein [Lentzea nigeriaca]MBM7863193.1 hypothetical protein [Lentzea nigeriaca]